MKIICDIDGVLADFVLGFTRIANGMFGSRIYGTVDQQEWNFEDGEFTKAQVSQVWEEIKRSNTYWEMLEPIPMEPGVFRELNMRNLVDDLYFVTSRVGVNVKSQTESWLMKQGIWNPTVVISDKKGEIASAVEADALLDDKPGNVLAVHYLSRKTVPYLIDRNYNRWNMKATSERIVRVKSVTEFLGFLILQGNGQLPTNGV